MSRNIIVAGAFHAEEPPPPWEPVELPPAAPPVQIGEASASVVETFERLEALESLPRQMAKLERLRSILKAAEAERDAVAANAAKAAGTVGLAPAGSAATLLKLNRRVKEARFDVKIVEKTIERLKTLLG